jgi:hypothetical protein
MSSSTKTTRVQAVEEWRWRVAEVWPAYCHVRLESELPNLDDHNWIELFKPEW